MIPSVVLLLYSSSILISMMDNFVKCNFCSENIQKSQNDELRFTKELSREEYGIGKHSKSLHCCAANYKSILWLKGDKLYPWKDGDSNFVLDPTSHNQTLYVKELSKHDSGTYSCYIVSDDSFYHTRNIPLTVFEIGFTGIPKPTYVPPARVTVDLDEPARLYCETFVGKIDLPDARSKISWYKVGANKTRTLLPNANNTRVSVKKVIRDEGRTIGMYLIVEHVHSDDYGQYVCSVSNTDDQINEMKSELVPVADYMFNFTHSHAPFLLILYGASLVILFLAIICFVQYRFRYDIQLCLRSCTRSDKNDANLEYDVCILYEPKEVNFVSGVLMPTLVNEYDFSVSSHVLECGSAINVECQSRIAVSQSVLAVLPITEMSTLPSQKYFSQKLYSLASLHTKVTCLLIQERPDISLSSECLNLINSMNLKFLTWPMYKKDWHKLWQALRLHLPIKRPSLQQPSAGSYSTVNDKYIVCSV